MPHFAKRPRLTFEPNFQTQSQMQGLMVAGAPVDEEEKKKKELEEKGMDPGRHVSAVCYCGGHQRLWESELGGGIRCGKERDRF